MGCQLILMRLRLKLLVATRALQNAIIFGKFFLKIKILFFLWRKICIESDKTYTVGVAPQYL